MKFLNWYKEFVVPPALFASLVIGAGMFSLPYLFSKTGTLVGLFYLLDFALFFSVIHLMYVEVLAKTRGEHAFLGYARIHLGRIGFLTSTITTALGIFLVLLIYLVLSVSFITTIFPAFTPEQALVTFWILATIPVILGIKRIANFSTIVTGFIVLIIAWIFVRGVGALSIAQITHISPENIFLPYSAILFAFAGRSAIGPIRQYLKGDRFWHNKLKPAVVIGTIASGFLYALFVLGVTGLSKNGVSMDAISGISLTHPLIRIGLSVLGILSIWTSYLFLGTELKNNLRFDFKLGPVAAMLLVAIIPPLFYFLGFDNFIGLISFSGGIFLAIESIMVILMWWQLEKPNQFRNIWAMIMIGVFALALVYQLEMIFS